MRTPLTFALLTVVLAGCGQVGAASSALSLAASDGPLEAAKVYSLPVTILQLVNPADKPADGLIIALDGSFQRTSFQDLDGQWLQGYRLWDHAGHSVLVSNVFAAPDVERQARFGPMEDFTPATRSWLLSYGTFVKVEGRFHPAGSPLTRLAGPAVDVYTIAGTPIDNLVSSSSVQ